MAKNPLKELEDFALELKIRRIVREEAKHIFKQEYARLILQELSKKK